jgi:hypothetical protein
MSNRTSSTLSTISTESVATTDTPQCSNISESSNIPSSVKIRVSIQGCRVSGARCIVCKKAKKLTRISPMARTQIFIDRGIIIPPDTRCCRRHLENGFLSKTATNDIEVKSNYSILDDKTLCGLLENLRSVASRKGLDFDYPPALTDDDYYNLTGLKKDQFDSVLASISGHIRSTSGRSPRTCLALLLTKLRTGLSLSVLSTLFALQKRRVGRAIAAARTAFLSMFVPNFLGTNHISREDFITKHTRTMAKTLFAGGEDVCILVADGTYMYIEKSSNYKFQRRTFSLHKGRPLVKPMILVSSTGYILEVFGPYFADGKNNDANILTSIMRFDASRLRSWLQPNDVLVVDRGFRDCLEMLQDLGLITKMPHFLREGSQHTTSEANESRLVTKIRWVIEAVNGLLKKWKALDHVFPNSQVPYVGDYVRIVSALCNAFRPPRISDDPNDTTIAERMLRLSQMPNLLQERVEREGWSRKRVMWQPVVADSLPDFPQLTLDELAHLTIGSYQLKQAQSYAEEHTAGDGMYELFVHRQERNILRLQIQSRHTSSKVYNLWIEYSQGINPIISWYCQCKVGARTVGCCAHVASVLWYLGYSRHSERLQERPSQSYAQYIQDAAENISDWSDNESGGDGDQSN